jgi:hypothetical protein
LPPQVVAVEPLPRSVSVSDSTVVRARFVEALDPKTATSTNVFLKIDTERVPISVALEDSGRTLVMRPLHLLDLRRTHTAVLTPRLHTATGGAFDTTFAWQFTTVGVRFPAHSEPATGSSFESPVTPLYWTSTDGNVGPVEYRVWISTDSAAVAAETAPSFTTSAAQYLPFSRWTPSVTQFWRVRVRNLETGDVAASRVWSFTVAPTDAPVDSVILPIASMGSYDRVNRRWACPNMTTNTNNTGVVAIDYSSFDSTWVVFDARLTMQTGAIFSSRTARLFSMDVDWIPCDPRYPGSPPIPDNGLIAQTEVIEPPVTFVGPRFASEIQARIRGHGRVHGLAIQSDVNITYTPGASQNGLKIVYVRAPGLRAAR